MSDESAAHAEVEPPASVILDWDGITVEVPATVADCDPDFLEAMEFGRGISAIRALVGSKEYERLRRTYEKKHGHRPTVKDINKLGDLVAVNFGFTDAGE